MEYMQYRNIKYGYTVLCPTKTVHMNRGHKYKKWTATCMNVFGRNSISV